MAESANIFGTGASWTTEAQARQERERLLQQEQQDRLLRELQVSAQGGKSSDGLGMQGMIGRMRNKRQLSQQMQNTSPEEMIGRLGDNVKKRIAALPTTMDEKEKELETLKIASQEASKLGMAGQAQQLATQYVTAKRTRIKEEVNAEKLVATSAIELAKAANVDQKIADENKEQIQLQAKRDADLQRVRNENGAFAAKRAEDARGAYEDSIINLFPLADPKGDPVMSRVDPKTGQWSSLGGEPMPADEWSMLSPTERGGGKVHVRDYMTPSDQQQHRDSAANIQKTITVSRRLLSNLERDTTGVLAGGGGKITKGAKDLYSVIKNSIVGLSTFIVPVVNSSGKTIRTRDVVGAREAAINAGAIFNDRWFDPSDDTVKLASGQSMSDVDFWKLTYAMARAMEPGGGRLSEGDIQRAAAMVGQGVTDIATLRDILHNNITDDLEFHNDRMKKLPEEVRAHVITQEGQQDLNDDVAGWTRYYALHKPPETPAAKAVENGTGRPTVAPTVGAGSGQSALDAFDAAFGG